MKDRAEKAEAELKSTRPQLETAKRDIASLNKRLESQSTTETQVTQLQNEYEDLEQKLNILQEELDSAQAKLTEITTERDTFSTELDQLRQQLQNAGTLGQEVSALKQEIDGVRQLLEVANQERDTVEDELNRSKANLDRALKVRHDMDDLRKRAFIVITDILTEVYSDNTQSKQVKRGDLGALQILQNLGVNTQSVNKDVSRPLRSRLFHQPTSWLCLSPEQLQQSNDINAAQLSWLVHTLATTRVTDGGGSQTDTNAINLLLRMSSVDALVMAFTNKILETWIRAYMSGGTRFHDCLLSMWLTQYTKSFSIAEISHAGRFLAELLDMQKDPASRLSPIPMTALLNLTVNLIITNKKFDMGNGETSNIRFSQAYRRFSKITYLGREMHTYVKNLRDNYRNTECNILELMVLLFQKASAAHADSRGMPLDCWTCELEHNQGLKLIVHKWVDRPRSFQNNEPESTVQWLSVGDSGVVIRQQGEDFGKCHHQSVYCFAFC